MPSVEKQRVKTSEPTLESGRGEPFAAGTTIARYKILSLLGSGAMGDVYRAHDRTLDREVALKVLPPELVHDRERVRRFAQEAKAASALSHPHIVTIHDIGHARPSTSVQPISKRNSEVHYIAMEFVDGRTLRDTMSSPLPIRRTVELLAQVADGLGKAHSAGIIHRDLKPENIIIATEGYAKVVDFGLAKLIDADRGWNPIGADSPTLRALTQNGEVLGTPGYMAPEQITGGPVDPRADVFSFGCILYEAITRMRPFESESFVDTLYKILHEQPPSIGAIAPGTPVELQRIVMKCLAKNREERYQSIRDAALDLRAWLHQGDSPAALPRRDRSSQLRIALLATTLAVVPILGWIFLGHRDVLTTSNPQQTIRRVTTNGRTAIGAISPDARYVAYVATDARGSSVWLEQLETKSTLQLVPPTIGHYVSVTFSRDGNYVCFVRYDTNMTADLARVPLLGGKPETLIHDIDTRPDFTPDGSRIAFVRDDFNKSTSTVMVANGNGSDPRALATLRLPDRAYSPSWSRDGEKLVVAQRNKVIEIAWPSGTMREIATHPRFESVRNVAWSGRSTLIVAAVQEDSTGHVRLWELDAKNGDAQPITDELADLVLPSLSADGKTIAAVQTIGQANVYTYDDRGVHQLTSGLGSANGVNGLSWLGNRVLYSSTTDGASSIFAGDQRLSEGPGDSHPAATPDGSAIVYAATTKNGSTIWTMNADGNNRRQLTNGPRDSDFAISPDSKTLAWASFDPKSAQWSLWTMPMAGGAPQKISTRSTLIEQLRYTPDGKTIVFTGYAGSMLRLYRIPANGGAVAEITSKRSWDSSVSSDGRSLICAYDFDETNNSSLATLSLDSSDVKTTSLNGSKYRWRGDNVTYLHEENGATNLWMLDRGTSRKLTDFSEGSIVDYAWSGDGKRAAITHVVDSSDVVVIRRK
ncbi:MAG TPA: protein kinase [Thermoanaerobaculia bacterium]|nr:protein kinase [Thermoanaerobaculia bacterium]